MMEQATNSVRSLATDSYNQAAVSFVNRDFAGCYDQLRPLLDKASNLVQTGQLSRQTLTKMFVLYATLADNAFNRIEEHGLTVKSRRDLQEAVLSGSIWKQTAEPFKSPADIPPTLILTLINVTSKHNGDSKVAQEFIETYMSQISPDSLSESDRGAYRQMIEAFVKQVLAANGEFLYGQEVVNNSNVFSTGQRLKVIAELEVAERKYKEEKARLEAEKREHEKQEAARVAKAIEDEKIAAEVASRATAKPSCPSPNQDKVVPTPESRRTIASRPRQSLAAYWRDVFKNYMRRHGVMNALVLLLLVVSATTNRNARDRIAGGSQWLWKAVKQSAAMVFTVTYL